MRFLRPGPGVAIFVITWVIFIVSPVRVLTDSRYAALVGPALASWIAGAGPVVSESRRPPLPGPDRGRARLSLVPDRRASPGDAVRLAAGSPRVFGGRSGRGVQRAGRHDRPGRLAATAMALLAVVVFKTALAVLPPRWSGVVALASVLGTQIWSNSSRVLWGDTFLVLIMGIAIWRLVLHEKGTRPLSAPLLATVLAWGYFARPTASIAIVAVTLYLLLHHRRLVLPFVATGASLARPLRGCFPADVRNLAAELLPHNHVRASRLRGRFVGSVG